MKIAYFDTVGGIAGDMTLAAFVSAGMSLDLLANELKKLPVSGFELIASHVKRSAVDAVHIDVVISQEPHYHRHLKDILAIIEGSGLSAEVKSKASAVFQVLAEAEAKIHQASLEQVHFHEVGALDSIVDIVGTAICMDHFGIERVFSSPVRLGSGGFVQTQHGRMPTPAPASLEILRGYPTSLTTIPHELTTPTGAAIIKALSSGILDEDIFTSEAIGYGAGTKEFPEIPNFLRLIIGRLDEPADRDQVVLVETNIDDMNPQLYPYVIEKLLAAGAHDAYLVPVIMKKGRPGILLSAMADSTRLSAIVETIYRETSTIGLRIQRIGRLKLPRRQYAIETSFGPVKVKAVMRGSVESIAPEYEECKRIALERRLPLLEVMRAIEQEIAARQP